MRCPRLAELPPPPSGRSGWPWTEESAGAGDFRGGRDADGDAPSWPRITIVTPSYNQGQYLEETIRSVLLQEYPNIEYVVIDGGSTDNSVEIIRKYERHLAWWVSERDKGPSHALNKGFARATGEIHAYLNSDDLYEAGALRAIVPAFRAGHQWVVGQVRYFQDGFGHWPVPQLRGRRYTDWFVTCPVSQPGCFWSASLHREMGELREDLAFFFDYEFWLRFRFVKKVVPFRMDQPVAVYRLHPHSKTVSQTAAFVPEGKSIRKDYERLLSRVRRCGLSAVRRHRKARALGSRGVTLLKEGKPWAATRQLISALSAWPLMVLDWGGILLAIRELVTRKDPERTVPMVFPEWDD
jgi:glycosyltransferase involved in cell wall biosynthesis